MQFSDAKALGPRMGHTIVSVAYPLTEVGPDAVGGSEQILTLLDRAITRAGHRSLVIAAEGSQVEGTLIASPSARGTLNDGQRQWAQKVHSRLLRETLARFPVDLVHMHSLDFHRYVPAGDVPVLATLHLPPDWYPRTIFKLKRPNFYLNCVSSSQRRACPRVGPSLLAIPNGIDVARFGGPIMKRNYALAMGRICPEKGFHFALDAARKAGVELLLAGETFPYTAHLEYFRSQIVPRLDKKRRFIGPVGFARKKRLMAEAKCLLIPSTVAETSSLVAMEALASGTPVIAFRYGALPEIVEDGRTGYLVSNAKQMADRIAKVEKLDPEVCRNVARVRFTMDKMVQRYFETYETIISNTASEKCPVGTQTSWLVNW